MCVKLFVFHVNHAALRITSKYRVWWNPSLVLVWDFRVAEQLRPSIRINLAPRCEYALACTAQHLRRDWIVVARCYSLVLKLEIRVISLLSPNFVFDENFVFHDFMYKYTSWFFRFVFVRTRCWCCFLQTWRLETRTNREVGYQKAGLVTRWILMCVNSQILRLWFNSSLFVVHEAWLLCCAFDIITVVGWVFQGDWVLMFRLYTCFALQVRSWCGVCREAWGRFGYDCAKNARFLALCHCVAVDVCGA